MFLVNKHIPPKNSNFSDILTFPKPTRKRLALIWWWYLLKCLSFRSLWNLFAKTNWWGLSLSRHLINLHVAIKVVTNTCDFCLVKRHKDWAQKPVFNPTDNKIKNSWIITISYCSISWQIWGVKFCLGLQITKNLWKRFNMFAVSNVFE